MKLANIIERQNLKSKSFEKIRNLRTVHKMITDEIKSIYFQPIDFAIMDGINYPIYRNTIHHQFFENWPQYSMSIFHEAHTHERLE